MSFGISANTTRHCKYCRSILSVTPALNLSPGAREPFRKAAPLALCPVCDEPGAVPPEAQRYYNTKPVEVPDAER